MSLSTRTHRSLNMAAHKHTEPTPGGRYTMLPTRHSEFGDHYGRVPNTGELIGPYETAAERDRDLIVAQAESLEDGPLPESSAYHGEADKELVAALDVIFMHGFADDQTGDVESPWCHVALVDRFILQTDSQGFKSALTYSTPDAARAEFDLVAGEYGVWANEVER